MALHARDSRPIGSRGQPADNASYDASEVAQTQTDYQPKEARRAEGSLHAPEGERPNKKPEFGLDDVLTPAGEPDTGPQGGANPVDRHGNKS